MNKFKSKNFTIKDNIFKTEVLFITNCDAGEFIRQVRKYGIKLKALDEYICGTVVKADRKFFRIVWIKDFSRRPENVAELVHEIFHLVVRICYDKGVPVRPNIETGECGDETAAYLMEFYAKICLARLKHG